jgi:hypothetical protein
MTEKDKLLELIESIDPKSVEYVEFTPDEYAQLKKEINQLGGKIKLQVIPPESNK